MLRQFLPQGRNAGIEGYRALRDELGRRPTLVEVFSRGFRPRTIAAEQGNWFRLLKRKAIFHNTNVLSSLSFRIGSSMLETTSLTKSYKMVVLRVLLDEGLLFQGIDLSRLCVACRRYLQNHEVLRRDLEGEHHAVDHQNADQTEWANWWIRWPISRWLDVQSANEWFARVGDMFRLNFDCPNDCEPSFEALTEEIVDWRLAAYSKSHRLDEVASGELAFEGKVSHAHGRPILFLPDRAQVPERPLGITDVELPDGSTWEFKFVKVACNVASPKGEKTNQLSQLLRQWFGSNAGLPGTSFTVRFETRNGVWHATPSQTGDAATAEPGEAAEEATVDIKPKVGRAASIPRMSPSTMFQPRLADGGPKEVQWPLAGSR